MGIITISTTLSTLNMLSNYKVGSEFADLKGQTLEDAIEDYNKRHSYSKRGQISYCMNGENYNGGIKVFFMVRPVSMVSPIEIEGRTEQIISQFTFKRMSAEMLQVHKTTTTEQVVQHIHRQFGILDDISKFCLYVRIQDEGTEFFKLGDFDRPLQLCLLWTSMGTMARKRFVLSDYNLSMEEYMDRSEESLEQRLITIEEVEKQAIGEIVARYGKYRTEIENQLRQHKT